MSNPYKSHLIIVFCRETDSYGVVDTTEHMPEPVWFDSEVDAKCYIEGELNLLQGMLEEMEEK